MSFSRTDRSRLPQWWFTVDHVLLSAILVLAAVGIVLSLAASPAVALKKGLPAFYFFNRHVMVMGLGLVLMLAVSLLDPARVRRLSLVLLAVSLVLLVVVARVGVDINGARRWLSIAGHSLQPSELAKPAFIVVSAWLFSQADPRPDMPAMPLAIGLLLAFAGLLLIQPDVGQTLLIVLVWGALLFLSGRPLKNAVLFGGVALAGIVAAYVVFDHVRTRVDRFLFSSGPQANSQLERAVESFAQGGFFGRGPGEGTIKSALPDAHTDFIFAVIAEEYGIIACLALVALFAFIVLRAFIAGWRDPDPANRLAVAGLSLALGLQALINMSVNVGLMPAKGMTLPFVSAGGSSLLSVAILFGMLLALTRRRPDALRLKKPRFAVTVDGAHQTGHRTT